MKKKLLTVLLAVVMVFGVFGLTACSGSNADADYNYYTSKYEIENVNIEAVTFQGVYKMFTTKGSFLLYVDSEGDGAADRLSAINDLANEWGKTIYHFNPNLAGEFSKIPSGSKSANILTNDIYGAGITTVQNTLIAASNTKLSNMKDKALWGITGAESTVSNGAVKYNGKIAKQVAYAASNDADDWAAALQCSQKMPSYGDKDPVDQYLLEGINTMNLFGDARLHMYNDDDGTDALLDEKTDLYVTVANYGMFEDLLNNNEGYFPVFFGGTWCPNTQAIAKLTNEIAKDYGVEKIYFFDPRLEDGTKVDAVVNGAIVENSAYLASSLNTRNTDADNQWKALSEEAKIEKYLLALTTPIDGNDVYKDDVSYDYDADRIQEIKDTALINAVETALTKDSNKLLNELKAKYTEAEWKDLTTEVEAEEVDASKYFGGVDSKEYWDAVNAAEAAAKAENEAKAAEWLEICLDASGVDADEVYAKAIKDEAAKTDVAAKITADLKSKVEAEYKASVYNYSFLYAAFLDNYIKDADGKSYASMWNVGVELAIGNNVYTKMCVPNIMMFNGEEADKPAVLVALAEAEYTYANTSEEGNPQNVAWTKAVKAVFDANPYLTYNPVVVEEVAATDAAASTTTSSSSSSSSASSSAEAC